METDSLNTMTLIELLEVNDRELNQFARKQLLERYSQSEYEQILEALTSRSSHMLEYFDHSNYIQIFKLWTWLTSPERYYHKPYYGSGFALLALKNSGDSFLISKANELVVKGSEEFIWNIMQTRYPTYYKITNPNKEDMYQAGMVGIMKAFRLYSNGTVDFIKYAENYVVHEMSRLAHGDAGIPQHSHHHAMEQKRINKAAEKYHIDLSCSLDDDTFAMIAKETSLSKKVVKQEINAMNRAKTIGFSTAENMGYSMNDPNQESVEDQAITHEQFEHLCELFIQSAGEECLQYAIERIIDHSSWNKIAEEHGTTAYKVHTALHKAISQIRKEHSSEFLLD